MLQVNTESIFQITRVQDKSRRVNSRREKASKFKEYDDPRSKPGKKQSQRLTTKFANSKLYIYYIAGLYL